jgi:hypothetical protein
LDAPNNNAQKTQNTRQFRAQISDCSELYHIFEAALSMVTENRLNQENIKPKGAHVEQSSINGSGIDDSDSSEHTDEIQGDLSVVHSDGNYDNAKAEVQKALAIEDRRVLLWKIIFKTIMIVVAVVITAATYVQLEGSETSDFIVEVRFIN